MDVFLLKVALSFLFGGAFVAFAIWLSEKFGSKLGGIVLGLPSTSLMGLLFIAWTQNNAAAVSAVPIMPAVSGVNSIFVAVFFLLYKFGWKKALAAAFGFWAVANILLLLLPMDSLPLSLLLAVVLYAISARWLARFPHRKLPATRTSKQEFLFRAVFAGAVVATAVLLAKSLGPIWGGLFSMFPAAFTSTMILVSRKHGEEFTASVARAMAFGSIASVAFCVAFYAAVPALGLVFGAALSFLASLAVGYLIYKFFL